MANESGLADHVRTIERTVATASSGLRASDKRRYRVDHGMCPNCGKEAAPYYLCWDCRSQASFVRLLKRGAKLGVFKAEKRGRDLYWSKGSLIDDPTAMEQYRKNRGYLWDMAREGRAPKPRMGRRPIDLDETLMSIFQEAGKPLRLEEVYFAWGRLRAKRKTASLAGDMSAIIKAQRRREERAKKRQRLNPPPARPLCGSLGDEM